MSNGVILSKQSGKPMRTNDNNSGYPQLNMRNERGEVKSVRVHRIIATTFLPNPNGYREVNHKDEDKHNNDISNLEWCTRQYNIKYSWDRSTTECKGPFFNSKEKQVEHLRRLSKRQAKPVRDITTGIEYESVNDAAAKTGFCASHIAKVCRGEKRTCHEHVFEFIKE